VLLIASVLTLRAMWREPFATAELLPRTGPWAGRSLAGLSRTSADVDAVTVHSTEAGPLTVVTVETDGDLNIHLVLGSEAASAPEVVAAALGAAAQVGGGQPGTELTATSRAPGVEIGVVESYIDGPALTVQLPRFTVQAGHDLIGRPELGLVTVTDATRGHFPGLSQTPLAVSAAQQRCVASFTERGFEAAAISQIEVRIGGSPRQQPLSVLVSFDRPFGLVARRPSDGLVLLVGWVDDVDDLPETAHPFYGLGIRRMTDDPIDEPSAAGWTRVDH